MEVITGNIIHLLSYKGKDIVGKCFTSNGVVKKDGDLIMGAGVAKAFRDNYGYSATVAGDYVRRFGNHVHDLGFFIKTNMYIDRVITFPTKHHFKDQSDIDLIIQSCKELTALIESGKLGDGLVLLPKPGCSNGGLDWDEVSKVIKPHLHEDVIIITM